MYPNNVGQTNPNDPYGFIMNNPQKPQRSLGPSGTKGRIIVVAVGILVLIILGIIFSTLLSSGDKAQTQRLLEISQRQTEIIRVSTQADKKAKSLSTRSYAVTTRVSLESSQKQVNEILAKRGIKEKALSKELSASKNTKTDEALSEAEKNNRFDETFLEIINKELSNYQKLLNSANEGASKSEKQVLTSSFKAASTIIAKPKTSPKPATTQADDDTATEDTSTEDEFFEEDL